MTDVVLHFTVSVPEPTEALETHILNLIKEYETELADGGELDRILTVPLRQRFPATFDELEFGPGLFELREQDFPDRITDLRVQAIVAQAIDGDGKGVSGVGFEISKPGTPVSLARTTLADGFSEDLSVDIPPIPEADRPDPQGVWQVRLVNPDQFSSLNDLLDTERFERFNIAGLHGAGAAFERVEKTRFSPPLLTKTWFHLGPTGDEFSERGEADFSDEYWSGDPAVLDRPAATVALLRSLPASQRADALRSLRGHVLRTELFALDGSRREDRPFTVTESQYGIREENAPAAGDGGRLRIFFPHPVAQRSTQWERGADPMHQFAFTDAYDPYGLPGRQISLAVPRGRDFRVEAAAGEPYLGTRTVTSYAQRDDGDRFIVDRVAATTTHEIVNDGSPALFDLLDAVKEDSAQLAMIGQTFSYYDGNAFVGLPLGQIGDFGALVRSETLVLTDEILRAAYRSGDPPGNQPERPPYLVPGGPPAWTDEYPRPFRDQLPPLAGHTFSAGGPDRARGYFVAASRQRYDFHDHPTRRGRGLVTATRDPLGRDTTVGYDRFDVLPIQVVDSAGLTTRAVHDYRVLQPGRITDVNGNRTAFAFTPLGLLERTAVMGKNGEPVGDTLATPGTRLVYDLSAFANSPRDRRQPISVRTIRRVHHAKDTDVPPAERDETIETVEYSDGFGRLIQTRIQAEDVIFGDPTFGANVLPAAQGDPATQQKITGQRNSNPQRPNVVVSGWQIYDNKGRVVERYEPFLASGWEYAPPADSQLGQRVTIFYDPRGQVVRSINPDGSEQRVIYGMPLELTDPELFTPTPWEAYTYDANDNAGRTHPNEAGRYENHWNTPANRPRPPGLRCRRSRSFVPAPATTFAATS